MEALAIVGSARPRLAPLSAASGWARGLEGLVDRHFDRECDLAAFYAAQATDVPPAWRSLAGACLVSLSRLPLATPLALRWNEARSPAFGLAQEMLAAAADLCRARGLKPDETGAVDLFERAAGIVGDLWAAILGPTDPVTLTRDHACAGSPAAGAAAYDLSPPGPADWGRARRPSDLAWGNPAAMRAVAGDYLRSPFRSAGVDRCLVAVLAGQVIVARLADIRLSGRDDTAAAADVAQPRRRLWRAAAGLGLVLAGATVLRAVPGWQTAADLVLLAGAGWIGATVGARRSRLRGQSARASRLAREVARLEALHDLVHGEPYALGDLRERLAGVRVDWPPVLRALVEDIAARGLTRL